MQSMSSSQLHSTSRFLPRPLNLGLIRLGHGIHNASNPSDPDGRHIPKARRVPKEQHARRGDRQLVERADHRVGGGSADADAPCRRIGDEDGGGAGEGDCGEEDDTIVCRAGVSAMRSKEALGGNYRAAEDVQVCIEAFRSPVFHDD